ncbi:MAG: hypothetical protein GX283_09030 [Clostridiaceae bacterium]|jgi:hypothetical protein|nr:hypothetical protein [Clostridiaceae bacterium]
MSENNELLNIPLPSEKDDYMRSSYTHPISPAFLGGVPDIKELLKKIQLDDILLLGLIILLATDDNCDNFLLILLVFIFLAGLDIQLLSFI